MNNNVNTDFSFTINSVQFNEDYRPSDNTRITTNFANLARGQRRKENLRDALSMINNRFNALASWDNESGDRYAVELEIVSVDIDVEGNGNTFPTIEILRTQGIVGNNFSSYVRDYDFSVRLSNHNRGQSSFSVPTDFGDLHGKLFKYFCGCRLREMGEKDYITSARCLVVIVQRSGFYNAQFT